MIATVFSFQAGGSSKDITGKFYLSIVKKIQAEANKNYLFCSIRNQKSLKASM